MVLPIKSHAYSMPLVNAATALGRALCELSNTLCHAESPASTNARASRYWYLVPSAMPYFKQIAATCYTCKKILQRRHTNIIAPLRSIGTVSLTEGRNLMIDVAGPWLLFCKPRSSQAVTRAAGRTKRDQIKFFVLVTVCMFSHSVECTVLDSMHMGSLQSALKQIMLSHGWSTKELSLMLAAENTIEELQQLEEKKDDDKYNQEREDNLDPAVASIIMDNLQQSRFKIRPSKGKALYKQSTVESMIKSFNKVIKESLLPTIEGMTATSFIRAVQMSTSTLNLRPVILLPPDSRKSGELTCISPQALHGPDHAEWQGLGGANSTPASWLLWPASKKRLSEHGDYTTQGD